MESGNQRGKVSLAGSAEGPLVSFLRVVYRVLALAFGVVGALFLMFPDGTVAALNGVGSLFGFPAAPPITHRFWLGLGVAYMTVVTCLAALIAAAPVERRILMVPLAVGKATSSLTCLWFFLVYDRFFVYLANFLTDASLAVLVWATYVASDPASRTTPGSLSSRGRRTLLAIAEVLFPTSPGGGPRPNLSQLADEVQDQLRATGPLALRGFELLLWFIEQNPLLFHGKLQGLSRLDSESRIHVLESMERSRLLLRRQAVHSVKLLLGVYGYRDARMRSALGVEDGWLADKLAQAKARRERGEKGPFPQPQPPE